MKIATLLATFLMVLGLTACGQKAEEAMSGDASPAVESTSSEAESPATATASGGGYEPSEEERVPGITMSQEEMDKIYEDAKTSMSVSE